MRSQEAKARKSEKARARRKDYKKKSNIRKNNWPTPRVNVEEPKLEPVRKEGKLTGEYKNGGSRLIEKKYNKKRLTPGDGILPKRRDFRESKKEKRSREELSINRIANLQATKK